MSDLTKSKTDYQEESKQQAEQQQIVIVTRLETNDVVMGRGAQAVAHLGNISFREIVSSRRQEYFDTAKRKDKDLIARQIAGAVRSRNGRFLRKLDSRLEAEQYNIPRGSSAWTLVDEDTVIQKVKQALRDSFQADDDDDQQQQGGGGNNDQQRQRTTSRDAVIHDDDNRPSRRRRIDPPQQQQQQQQGSNNYWTTSSASVGAANPLFQQLADDALREYQEGRAGVRYHGPSLPGGRRYGLPDRSQQQQQFPAVPFASHIPAGQQEYHPESAFFDLLHATAHPEEGQQDSTEVQRQPQSQQQQDPALPPGEMPSGPNDADSKPAAS